MDAGNVLEFGSTVDLLADENSPPGRYGRASGIPVGDEYDKANEEAKASSGEMQGCRGESKSTKTGNVFLLLSRL